MSLSDVTLIDGRQVRSDSEEWRAECEARAVLRMRSRNARRAWLLKVEQRRGKENADKLYRDVMRLWEHEKKSIDVTRVTAENYPNDNEGANA